MSRAASFFKERRLNYVWQALLYEHSKREWHIKAIIKKEIDLENPLILRIESKAGHSGANGLKKGIKQQADILSFVYQEFT